MYLLGKSGFPFVLGFGIGVLLAIYYTIPKEEGIRNASLQKSKLSHRYIQKSYAFWLDKLGFHRKRLPVRESSLGRGVKTESDFLFERVNILCVVFYTNVNNAYSAKYTWGERCNKIVFYGRQQDYFLSSYEVKARTSWEFLCRSLRHLWEIHKSIVEWVIVVHDDVFVIPENLRYLVAALNSSEPHYFGHNLFFWNQIYNSAKAGFVLSKGTLQLFSSKFNTSSLCISYIKYNNNEDYYLGKALGELGVIVGDSRDNNGRERFHEFTPAQLMAVGNFEVIQKNSKKSFYPVVQGHACCSLTSITFQGTEEDLIFFYSYLLYTVRVFSSMGHATRPKTYTKTDQVWERFIKEELGPNVNLSLITADLYYKIWTIKEESPEQFNRKIRDEVLGRHKS